MVFGESAWSAFVLFSRILFSCHQMFVFFCLLLFCFDIDDFGCQGADFSNTCDGRRNKQSEPRCISSSAFRQPPLEKWHVLKTCFFLFCDEAAATKKKKKKKEIPSTLFLTLLRHFVLNKIKMFKNTFWDTLSASGISKATAGSRHYNRS